jgi:hypothetical protein
MINKQTSILLATLAALLVVVVAVVAGRRLYRGDNSLLRNVSLGHPQITPNADGDDDATPIHYELSDNATVSIYFEDTAGSRYNFRLDQSRGAGEYDVLFSGVVDGYTLPGENIQGEIITRLLPDGDYTWTVAAATRDGRQQSATGQLTIAEADPVLPELRDFSLDRALFTPNRDGIDDRVKAQLYLTKEVAELRVFLETPEGAELPIAELEREVPARMPGRHYFDYEGGVDNNATPPADGTYTVVAEAADAEGQRVRVTEQLTINLGGVPLADIFAPPIGESVQFNSTAVALCDTLYFTVTVENFGDTPIRTTGPAPGTIYDSDWNYNTLGWSTESGAWRIAIGYENQTFNYPYRWAIGSVADLEWIDGYYYLMPKQRATITGGIRLTGPFGERNPQPVWAGLIHEDVGVSQFNDRVSTQEILVDLPDEANRPVCPEREVPVRPAE